MTARGVVFEQHVFRSPRVPAGLDGLRLVLLADLHFRNRPGEEERAVESRLAGYPAGALLLCGDLVDHRARWDEASRWLADLGAAIPFKAAVPGNWDHRMRGGLPRFRSAVERAGFRPLCNQAAFLCRNGARLALVGLDDELYGRPAAERAFRGIAPDDFVLVMLHNPDGITRLAGYRFDLLLAGHTHGGQIRLPGWGAVTTSTRSGRRYAMGWCKTPAGRPVYVSRGVGSGRLRWRWRCPPEVTAITLRRDSEGAGAVSAKEG